LPFKRFQTTIITEGRDGVAKRVGEPYTILVRCVQGHSGATGANINHELLCTRLTNAATNGLLTLIHHTKSQYIAGMIGWRSHPGILPGGLRPNIRGQYSARTDVHASDRPFSDGQFPDGFNRPGTDCAVHIDAQGMINDQLFLYRNPAGIILIPSAVDMKYITRIVMVTLPKICLYRRPEEGQSSMRNTTDATDIRCPNCNMPYLLGTQFCLGTGGCWQPLTYTAISDKYNFVIPKNRNTALHNRYKASAKYINTRGEEEGSGVRQHDLTIMGDETYFPPMAIPKSKKRAASEPVPKGAATATGSSADPPHVPGTTRTAMPKGVPTPAAAAVSVSANVKSCNASLREWRLWGAPPGPPPRPKTAPKRAATPTAAPRQPPPRQPPPPNPLEVMPTDRLIKQYMLRAWRGVGGIRYRGHTHRYDDDLVYRGQMLAMRPHPTPRILRYSDGTIAQDDWQRQHQV
jgi:hypothetical protein